MKTVVIFGSRSIKKLPDEAKKSIDKIMELNLFMSVIDRKILVGDAYGVDTLVQKYLWDAGYRNVNVCFPSNKCRSNYGFSAVRVGKTYKDRDDWMLAQCTWGLAIWDGKSPGTQRNIEILGNRCKVIRQ